MLNRWIRYFPVRDLLDSDQAEPMLEVGSGNLGLGEFISRPFIGCDVLFDRKLILPLMTPVCASGTRLPFKDAAFNTVLCLDTMEHVPRSARRAFTEELLRVSKKVLIIGAPMGDAAAAADQRLHEYYDRRNVAEPLWLTEHISLIGEFPQASFFEEIVREMGFSCEIRKGESALVHRVVILLEHTRIIARGMILLSRMPWRYIILPLLRIMNRSASYRTYLVVRKP